MRKTYRSLRSRSSIRAPSLVMAGNCERHWFRVTYPCRRNLSLIRSSWVIPERAPDTGSSSADAWHCSQPPCKCRGWFSTDFWAMGFWPEVACSFVHVDFGLTFNWPIAANFVYDQREDTPMEFSTVLLLICVPLLIISLYFVRRQAQRIRSGTCPRCGAPLPMEEATAQGWTCAKCGSKIDKYGRASE
jgi:ribosomal protein S27AE